MSAHDQSTAHGEDCRKSLHTKKSLHTEQHKQSAVKLLDLRLTNGDGAEKPSADDQNTSLGARKSLLDLRHTTHEQLYFTFECIAVRNLF